MDDVRLKKKDMSISECISWLIFIEKKLASIKKVLYLKLDGEFELSKLPSINKENESSIHSESDEKLGLLSHVEKLKKIADLSGSTADIVRYNCLASKYERTFGEIIRTSDGVSSSFYPKKYNEHATYSEFVAGHYRRNKNGTFSYIRPHIRKR